MEKRISQAKNPEKKFGKNSTKAKFTKVVFFGASVTAQEKNQNEEVTGYVPNIKKLIEDIYGPRVEVVRYGMVGSHFDTAACMCLNDIKVHLGPRTIVVSEWHSTSLPAFDSPALSYYYHFLKESGATVLTLVLPMLSQVSSERSNIKQTRTMQGDNFFQLNLYDVGLDLQKCIRDEQHTTPFGGEQYAKKIFASLQNMISGGEGPNDPGEKIPLRDGDLTYPETSHQPLEGEFKAGDIIEISIPDTKERAETVQIFSKLFKGPRTAQLIVRLNGETYIQETWSQYTYYEHPWTTFSPLTPALSLETGTNKIQIEVSKNIPDYEVIAEGNEKALSFMKRLDISNTHLKLTDGLYGKGIPEFSIRTISKAEKT